MTLSIIVALKKKFFFMRLSLWEAFSPKYIDILIQSVFSPYEALPHIRKLFFVKVAIMIEVIYFNV